MNKHTPGPWTFKGRTVRGPHPKDPKGRTRIVANAVWDRGTYVDDAEANARLIAAAPELLEALEMMLEMSEMGGFGKAAAEDVARAAIAKAKGE